MTATVTLGLHPREALAAGGRGWNPFYLVLWVTASDPASWLPTEQQRRAKNRHGDHIRITGQVSVRKTKGLLPQRLPQSCPVATREMAWTGAGLCPLMKYPQLHSGLVPLYPYRQVLLGHTETLRAWPCSTHGIYQQRNGREMPVRGWLLGGSRWSQKKLEQVLGGAQREVGMEAPGFRSGKSAFILQAPGEATLPDPSPWGPG